MTRAIPLFPEERPSFFATVKLPNDNTKTDEDNQTKQTHYEKTGLEWTSL
jgi:hypothetical protein